MDFPLCNEYESLCGKRTFDDAFEHAFEPQTLEDMMPDFLVEDHPDDGTMGKESVAPDLIPSKQSDGSSVASPLSGCDSVFSDWGMQRNSSLESEKEEPVPVVPVQVPLPPQVNPQSSLPQDYRLLLMRAREVLVDMSNTAQQMSRRLSELEQAKLNSMTPSFSNLDIHVGDMEKVWYAERVFPSFDVAVVAKNTNAALQDTIGFKVRVSVVDGFGAPADDKLSKSGVAEPLTFDVVQGFARVSGLRFNTVSSKCGGHYRFILTLVGGESSSVSNPVQILSYRLYHSQKLGADKLQPEDSILKIRGIGVLYAKRLAVLGIGCVRDLAEFNMASLSEQNKTLLMDSLRKDRGALTLSKLEEYVKLARAILARHSPIPQPKRRRLMGDIDVAPPKPEPQILQGSLEDYAGILSPIGC